MNVLEKILEEIEETERRYDEHTNMFALGGCSMAAEIKEIICSHINDNFDDWIPCGERLPEESGHYRVTVKNITEEITEQTAYFTEGQWRELYKCEQVIAWRKMQPYISESLAEREGE